MNTAHAALTQRDRLEVIQLYVNGLISRRTAIEASRLVKDVDEEIRRIEEEAGTMKGEGHGT